MNNSKIYSLLGIARKAGKITSGEFSVETALKSRKSVLVVIAADASDNTKKKFRNMCDFREVPWFECGTRIELGQCIGCGSRSVVSISDEGLAAAIKKQAEIVNEDRA